MANVILTLQKTGYRKSTPSQKYEQEWGRGERKYAPVK